MSGEQSLPLQRLLANRQAELSEQLSIHTGTIRGMIAIIWEAHYNLQGNMNTCLQGVHSACLVSFSLQLCLPKRATAPSQSIGMELTLLFPC